MPPYARLHTAPHYSSRLEAARSRNQRVTQALSRFLPDDLSHFDGGRELPSTRDAAPCISALSGARDTRDHKFSRKPRGLRSMESVLCAQARAPARARAGTPAVSKSTPPRESSRPRASPTSARYDVRREREHERPHTNARTTPREGTAHERLPHHRLRPRRNAARHHRGPAPHAQPRAGVRGPAHPHIRGGPRLRGQRHPPPLRARRARGILPRCG